MLLPYRLYRSLPFPTSFDNTGDPTPAEAPGETPGNSAAGEVDKLFTQEDVNRFLAEDRRKHQAQLQKIESQYQELLKNQNLTEQERTRLVGALDDVQKQLRTKEQQLAYEKKQLEEQYQSRLSEAEKNAGRWEGLYKESMISRALQDAAVQHDAFRPDQVVSLLRPMTKLVEEIDSKTGKSTGALKPMIDFPDMNQDTGESFIGQLTPADALRRMKEIPEVYGNLFKSGVVSGIGANSATGGLTPGANGRVDVRKLTPQQYREIRQKNPELLGLRPRGRQ